jgi:hypothetical protein
LLKNAVPVSFSGGITLGALGAEVGAFASLRGRYFSPRPLDESGDAKSGDAFQLNARVGHRKAGWELALEALNLFDSNDNDIQYLYTSRLPGEPLAGVEDRHIHPCKPRQLRLSLSYRW